METGTTAGVLAGDTRCRALPADDARYERLLKAAPESLGALFLNRVKASGHLESYRRRLPDGSWASETWAETGATVTELAAGLLALGLRPEDRVAVAATTRVEWIHADLAVLCAGGATTTVYPTSTAADVEHIVTDSGSRFAIVEDDAQLAKLRSQGVTPEKVVLIDGEPGADAADVLSWAALRELGKTLLEQDPDAVVAATAAVRAGQLATLIYTSGTTGRPKGVRLSHGSWVYESVVSEATGLVEAGDLSYLWLPMSHSFGKLLLGSQLAVGHATAVDGDVSRIVTNLPVIRPTLMAAAPRVYEKIYAGVTSQVRQEGGAKLKIFTWALGVGKQVSALQQQGKQPGGLLALQHALADKLVFSKVRERFGGRFRLMISGSAPLSREVAEFMHAVGILVLEGYGLTETSAGTFVNRPDDYEFGTVGLPFPGTTVKIAEDGEILVAGPGLMQGYHNLPEATAEMLRDGWLYTGDIGEITAAGKLKITDRKKDLIKTSGGKYVAPQSIETLFKVACPLASQIVIHGDGRNFITALVALDPDAVAKWAEARGMAGTPFAELARSPQVRDVVQQAVDQVNSGLGRWETVKKFEILDRDLTVEGGELTPSLKLKRRAVEKQYADLLDSFYQEP